MYICIFDICDMLDYYNFNHFPIFYYLFIYLQWNDFFGIMFSFIIILSTTKSSLIKKIFNSIIVNAIKNTFFDQ